MGPKKVSPAAKETGKRARITLEVKKEIISKHEAGMRLMDLARHYGKAASTIGTILASGDTIKGADVARGVSMLSKLRPPLLEEVEKLLLVWINEKHLAGDSVSEAIICEKARQLHANLVRRAPGTSAEVSAEEFKASRGWFQNFKNRTGIHVVRHGEAASSDKAAVERYIHTFKTFVDDEGYVPQQVFNCDETGLFWKKGVGLDDPIVKNEKKIAEDSLQALRKKQERQKVRVEFLRKCKRAGLLDEIFEEMLDALHLALEKLMDDSTPEAEYEETVISLFDCGLFENILANAHSGTEGKLQELLETRKRLDTQIELLKDLKVVLPAPEDSSK